jgi:hypothetical protein
MVTPSKSPVMVLQTLFDLLELMLLKLQSGRMNPDIRSAENPQSILPALY